MARTKASKPIRNPAAVAKATGGGDHSLTKISRPVVPEELKAGKPKTRTFKRWRPGTVAVRQMRREQKKTTPAIPMAPFVRVVQEMVQKTAQADNIRVSKKVYPMLQAAVEDFAIDIFKRAQIMAIDNQHITVIPRHIKRAAQTENEIRTRIVATTG